MSLDADTVRRVASLARIRMEPAELARMEAELNGILGWVEQLQAVPEERRPYVALAQLMVPFTKLAKADPDEDLSDVLARLNPTAPVVTVWREGKLLGVVPRRRLLARGAASVVGVDVGHALNDKTLRAPDLSVGDWPFYDKDTMPLKRLDVASAR